MLRKYELSYFTGEVDGYAVIPTGEGQLVVVRCLAKEFYRVLAYVQHPWGRIVVILIMFAPIRVGSHTPDGLSVLVNVVNSFFAIPKRKLNTLKLDPFHSH